MHVEVKMNDQVYAASVFRDAHGVGVSIARDGVRVGVGRLLYTDPGYSIVDCPADLGEPVYSKIEEEIGDAFARGNGAEVDPAANAGRYEVRVVKEADFSAIGSGAVYASADRADAKKWASDHSHERIWGFAVLDTETAKVDFGTETRDLNAVAERS